jgi:hypothetical protein
MKSAFDGVMILIVILFLVVILVSLFMGVSKEWIFAFLTAILSVLGWIYSNAKNSQREIEARLFSEKAALYKKIFSLFPDMVKKLKLVSNEPIPTPVLDNIKDNRELAEKMIDIKSELLIWGSEETIKTWIEIENYVADSGDSPSQIVLKWGSLYSCMRADLGHSDTQVKGRDLIGMFLKAESRGELSE